VLVPEGPRRGLCYSAADLAVCAEPVQTYTRDLLEAMAVGLPIVSPPIPRTAHEVSDGVNVSTYDDGDARGLARAIERLLGDESERARLARASPLVLAALPDFESTVQGYASLIREAWLSGGPRAHGNKAEARGRT